MDFLFGLVLQLIGTCIEGAYGMAAWNMAIPVIFPGAPKISLLQSIIIAFVVQIMTYDGAATQDKIETESCIINGAVRILMTLVVSSILLAILWCIMKFIY